MTTAGETITTPEITLIGARTTAPEITPIDAKIIESVIVVETVTRIDLINGPITRIEKIDAAAHPLLQINASALGRPELAAGQYRDQSRQTLTRSMQNAKWLNLTV